MIIRARRRLLPLSATRPRAILAGVVLLSVGFGGGALVTMRYVKSPAQAAAEATPPDTGPVTVAVERRILRSTLVMRGQVEHARSTVIRSPAGATDGKPVVTRLPVQVGDSVNPGQVVAEVSGRPVIVLPGASPTYRKLVPGAEGADVAQLQAAMRSLGTLTGSDRSGFYGPATKAAVEKTYVAAGYRPQPTGEDDGRQLIAAQRRVRDAQRALDRATAQQGESDVEVTRQAVADAKQDLDDLTIHTGPTVQRGEIVFVPTLPAKVAAVTASVGAEAPETLLTIAGDDLVVRAQLTARDGQLVRDGQRVEIASEVLGLTMPGVVMGVGPPASKPGRSSGTGDGQGPDPAAPQQGPTSTGIQLEVRGDAPLDQRLSGQDVRLTVEQASSQGEVLVVPLAAVSARADGQAQIVRMLGDASEERIAVTAGVSGGGYVEVRPVGGPLSPGDRVVVGR